MARRRTPALTIPPAALSRTWRIGVGVFDRHVASAFAEWLAAEGVADVNSAVSAVRRVLSVPDAVDSPLALDQLIGGRSRTWRSTMRRAWRDYGLFCAAVGRPKPPGLLEGGRGASDAPTGGVGACAALPGEVGRALVAAVGNRPGNFTLRDAAGLRWRDAGSVVEKHPGVRHLVVLAAAWAWPGEQPPPDAFVLPVGPQRRTGRGYRSLIADVAPWRSGAVARVALSVVPSAAGDDLAEGVVALTTVPGMPKGAVDGWTQGADPWDIEAPPVAHSAAKGGGVRDASARSFMDWSVAGETTPERMHETPKGPPRPAVKLRAVPDPTEPPAGAAFALDLDDAVLAALDDAEAPAAVGSRKGRGLLAFAEKLR